MIERMLVMVQREVGERMAAGRGRRRVRCSVGQGRVLRRREGGGHGLAERLRTEAQRRQRARAPRAPRHTPVDGRRRSDVRSRPGRLRDPAQDAAQHAGRPHRRRAVRACAASIRRPARRRSRSPIGRGSPMPEIVVTVSAKLTLSLHITGTRADGYHELDATMVSIEGPHDVLVIEPAPSHVADGDRPLRGRRSDRRLEPRVARGRRVRRSRVASRSTRASRRAPASAGDRPTPPACSSRCGPTPTIAATLGADVPFCMQGGAAHVGGYRRSSCSPSNSPAGGSSSRRRSSRARLRRCTGPGTSSAARVMPSTTSRPRPSTSSRDCVSSNDRSRPRRARPRSWPGAARRMPLRSTRSRSPTRRARASRRRSTARCGSREPLRSASSRIGRDSRPERETAAPMGRPLLTYPADDAASGSSSAASCASSCACACGAS